MCSGFDKCPICDWNKKQKVSDPKTKDLLKARQIYTFNVLDRTPTVVCPECNVEHYGTRNKFPEKCGCSTDLSGVEVKPRNKIQIMQKGKRIVEQFEAFEKDTDFGSITTYDIKLDIKGKGSDSMTACIPKQPSNVDMKSLLGEDWEEKLYDVKKVVTPLAPEKVSRILNGESFYDVVK
jgi:hypothetical protein